MPDIDPAPDKPEDQEPDSQAAASEEANDEEKLLEDLDAEDETAAGVQGGIRIAGARHHGRAGSL